MLLTIKHWVDQRPWPVLAAVAAAVLASTAVGALVHHARGGFCVAVFIANAAYIALRFVDAPDTDRGSLFMRRR